MTEIKQNSSVQQPSQLEINDVSEDKPLEQHLNQDVEDVSEVQIFDQKSDDISESFESQESQEDKPSDQLLKEMVNSVDRQCLQLTKITNAKNLQITMMIKQRDLLEEQLKELTK
jgi:hypothetical protein